MTGQMTGQRASAADRRRRLAADAARLRRFQRSKFGYVPLTWFLDPAWIAVLLHRLSARAWAGGRRKLGRLLMQLNSMATGADINPDSSFGPGLLIPSPCGVRMSGIAGRNFTALALAGVGASAESHVGGQPVLGDDVTMAAFSGINGGIAVGDGVVFGPGSAAQRDVPPGARLVFASEILQSPAAAAGAPVAPPPRGPPPACRHADWGACRADLEADVDRYREAVAAGVRARVGRLSTKLTNQLIVLWIYRRSHWRQANGDASGARRWAALNRLLFKVAVHPASCIGPGALAPHLAGTVFCGHAGARLSLYANVLCLADRPGAGPDQAPWLGDEVTLGGHAGVYGPVEVGDRVTLAPKVELERRAPDDCLVFSGLGRSRTETAADAPAPRAGPPPSPLAWAETRSRLRRDRERLAEAGLAEAGLARAALACVRLHRLSHHFFRAGALRRGRWFWLANAWLTGADISPASDIGPGLLVPDPAGLVVHGRAGADLTLAALSGLGPVELAGDALPGLGAAPRLGDQVHFAPHCGAYGAVTVGSNVIAAPGCIVLRDLPAGVRLSLPPVRLRRRGPKRRAALSEADAATSPSIPG
jgi:serine O-acetyltransferase